MDNSIMSFQVAEFLHVLQGIGLIKIMPVYFTFYSDPYTIIFLK